MTAGKGVLRFYIAEVDGKEIARKRFVSLMKVLIKKYGDKS